MKHCKETILVSKHAYVEEGIWVVCECNEEVLNIFRTSGEVQDIYHGNDFYQWHIIGGDSKASWAMLGVEHMRKVHEFLVNENFTDLCFDFKDLLDCCSVQFVREHDFDNAIAVRIENLNKELSEMYIPPYSVEAFAKSIKKLIFNYNKRS